MATLAQARRTLDNRLGPVIISAGLPINYPTVPDDAYADAISYALALMGVIPADPTNPTDAEVQSIPALPVTNYYKFADIAEVRLLDTAATALSLRPTSIELPDVKKQRAVTALLAYVEVKRKNLKSLWGIGVPTIGGGYLTPRATGRLGGYYNDFS